MYVCSCYYCIPVVLYPGLPHCSAYNIKMESWKRVSMAVVMMVVMAEAFTVIVPDSPEGPPKGGLLDDSSSSSSSSSTTSNSNSANATYTYTAPDEQAAVYQIMAATGNTWALDIADVCRGRWHGIECMADADAGAGSGGGLQLHVVALSFGALSDDTAFPPCSEDAFISPAIGRLPHLRRLFFYRCCWASPRAVPAGALAALAPSLESLVLRENGHVGAVPAELAQLTRLHTLDLHGNSLAGALPPQLFLLPQLQLLDLSCNRLDGPLLLPPQSQSQSQSYLLPRIRVLDLHQNRLRGALPAGLGLVASSLVKLDLSRNRLGGTVPDTFGQLLGLVLLDLGYNSLGGPLPEALGQLEQLQALIVQGNAFGGTALPRSLGRLRRLTTLVASEAGLGGGVPESVAQMVALRVLCLDGNRLNGSVPAALAHLPHLTKLKLNNNMLSGPLPFGRQLMWKLGRRLHVSNNTALCYNGSGSSNHSDEDDVDADWFFDLGIRRCHRFARTTAHVSATAGAPLQLKLGDISQSSDAQSLATWIGSSSRRRRWRWWPRRIFGTAAVAIVVAAVLCSHVV